MAHRFWPGEDAVGKRLRRRRKSGNPWIMIVGVAGDVQDGIPGAKLGNTFYVPLQQDPISANPTVHLLVRTSVEPAGLTAAVRREVMAVDRDQPLDKVATMDEWVASSFSKRRFSTFMLSLFAGLGIFLATIGIYGMLSYSVSRRNHEMGVRMALGAQGSDVVRLVLLQGMSLATVGLAIGLGLALSLTRLLAGLLYDVKATDPAVLSAIVAGLGVVAALASYLPARRAARIDPIISLRQE
jgi:putative ABC transport system permease protein